MITISLIGGLGNQMFQYAAGKALAERHGVGLALDVSGFRNYALRPYLLDRLCVPEAPRSIASESAPAKAPAKFRSALWWQRLDRLLGRAGLPKLESSAHSYRESHFHYDPAFEAVGPEVALFGYFQSELYFVGIAGKLRDWFSLREPLGPAAATVAAMIDRSALPVSIHIRRGDYTRPGTAEVHGILDEGYYRRALGLIEAQLGVQADFFIFSDDPAAAEEILGFVPAGRLTHARGDPERPWEDMALMARCRHHVVANSSFSWWGAWLNRSLDNIVVAPRAWFSPRELRERNTCDLYPSRWILL